MQEYNLTPEEEERYVEAQFRDLLDGYLASNHRKKVDIIERAFRFAKEAHKGVRRRSGEPYILHPIAVAKIASQEIGLGSTSICAALLHDVVDEDGNPDWSKSYAGDLSEYPSVKWKLMNIAKLKSKNPAKHIAGIDRLIAYFKRK